MKEMGGCLCGAITYSYTSEPTLVGVCHCQDCQKFTGSAFSFLVAVAEEDLEIAGELQTFSKPGDSGQPIHRQFCPNCGSSISEVAYTRPGLVLINGGTLHNPDELTPSVQIYCQRELPWAEINENIVRFEGAPE